MSGALLTRPPATTTSVTGTSPKARAPHERGLLARSGLVAARRRVPQVAERGLGLAPGLALAQVAQRSLGLAARVAGAHVLQRGTSLAGRVAVLGSAQPRDQPGPPAPNLLLHFGHRGLSSVPVAHA